MECNLRTVYSSSRTDKSFRQHMNCTDRKQDSRTVTVRVYWTALLIIWSSMTIRLRMLILINIRKRESDHEDTNASENDESDNEEP